MKLEGLEPVQILRSNRNAATVSVFAFNSLDVSLVDHKLYNTVPITTDGQGELELVTLRTHVGLKVVEAGVMVGLVLL